MKELFYTVYKTTNIVNGKYYIGKHQTTNLNDDYIGSGIALQQAIVKYGIENFVKEILFVYNNKIDMEEKEKELVNEELINDSDCYNIATGGQGGNLGETVNQKIGKTMSKILKGKKKSNAHKKSISAAKQGYKFDSSVVKRRVETWKKKINSLTPEQRKKLFGHSGNKNGFYDKKHSSETKQKIRDTKGSSREGGKNANAKPVVYNGVRYSCKKDCYTALGISKGKLNKLLGDSKMNNKVKGGLSWHS